jgi:hypothetical protein
MRLGIRLALTVFAVASFALLRPGFSSDTRPAVTPALAGVDALPSAPEPALQVGPPQPLASGRNLARWSVVRAPTSAHSAPRAIAPLVAKLATTTPDGTPNALPVLGAKAEPDGSLWVRVRLPMLPNGSVGWVRRRSLGAYQTVDTRLVVNRRLLLATLFRNGKPVFSAPVGIGTDAWPTPAGKFMVRSELTRFASPFYGPVAFGTSARSAVLTDWPGGGFVGIHGTNRPELIPGRISHGCIRMRNPDILRLAALMPVGTPLTIE